MQAIVDRQKSATSVLAANRRFAKATAGQLRKLLASELFEGEELPDVALLQELFARALERRWRQVERADEAHCEVGVRHREALAERDEQTRALYREVVERRGALRAIFGAAGASRFLGFSGVTSRDPKVLLRQADRVTAGLRDRSRPLPLASIEPCEKERVRWAAPIEARAEALRSAVARVSLVAREVDLARIERRRAMEGWNTSFVEIAGWHEATYRVVGRGDRAEAVRPSRRYRGLTHRQAKRRSARAASAADQPEAVETEPVAGARLLSFEPLRRAAQLLGLRRRAG